MEAHFGVLEEMKMYNDGHPLPQLGLCQYRESCLRLLFLVRCTADNSKDEMTGLWKDRFCRCRPTASQPQ